MRKAGFLLLMLLAAGCASESRERLNMLRQTNEPAAERGSSSSRENALVRVEVSPETRSRRVNTEQIVMATVFDRTGNPKTRTKVEWSLEGPGKIVAIDEGTLLNRGKRVDANFGYAYTATSKRTINGENFASRQDFDIQTGQTWCLITSAEPGRTSLIARVMDGGAGDAQAVASIRWTESESRPIGSRGTTSEPDTRGVDVRGLPTARSESSLVSLDVQLPKAIGLNRDATAKILLANNGRQDSQPLTVRATIPESVEILRIDPPVIRRNGNALTWAYERLAAGETQDISIVLRPRERGSLSLTTTAETADGLRAEQRIGANVDSANVKLQIDTPSTAATGGTLPVRITVTNTGAVTIENAIAWVDGPDANGKPIEKLLGTIPTNESKTVTVNLPIERAGRLPVRVNLTADGGVSDRAESMVQIGQSDLELTMTGSESFPVGQDGLFEFRVTNRGDAPLADVVVQAQLPKPLRAVIASEAGRSTEDGASWTLGTLAAGESKVARLSVAGDRISESATITARAEGQLASGQRIRAKDTNLRVKVVGLAVLTLRLEDPAGPVTVGGRVVYRATIQNRGNASARDVLIVATASDELRPVRGNGPNRQEAKLGQQSFTIPTIGEIPAGGKVVVTFEAEAIKPGSSRFAVEIKSRELEQPIKEEQATQIATKKSQ